MTKVTIEYHDIQATCDGIIWACQDTMLFKMLNLIASREAVQEKLMYVPDYACAMAQLAVEQLPGARIIKVKGRGKDVPGRIY
jgi:hypothetical protein